MRLRGRDEPCAKNVEAERVKDQALALVAELRRSLERLDAALQSTPGEAHGRRP